ncbi:MAG: glycosyltransferase family 2 protein [Paracoccaceae bacterium]|nr:MAG: glycosyltransferase family 2 protein [Paracoccaceae bacterium]
MRILALLTVRNEGAFLIEWLAHHRLCGVTDVLAFSNDCDDGTDAMLDRLQAMGWLTHLRNDGPHPQGPQWAALKAAPRQPLYGAADWVIGLDIDEFVNVAIGDRTLPALIAALPDAAAVVLTWRMFGNAGVDGIADVPVMQQFTRAAPRVLHWPWRAQQVKTLYRNDGTWAKPGVHRPRAPDRARAPDAAMFDGAGQRLPPAWPPARTFSPPGQDHYALAQVNHYALGAMQSYLVKCDRGRANRDASAFDMGYWIERNFCDVEDRSILPLCDAAAPLRAGLLADPVLGPLHHAAVAWRQARFAALMASDESWRALYGRLLMTPPTRALTAAQAARIWRAGLRPAPGS